MLRREDCTGIWVPIVTPFRDEALALELLPALVESHLAAGVRGFLALGTTGEAPHVTDDEAPRIVAAVVAAVRGRTPVLAGCGRASTAATIALGARLADAGAAGLLVLTPHVYRAASSAAALRAHFEQVAARLPVPAFIYHMPDLTGLDLEATLLTDLLQAPNIWGFKDSSNSGGPLAAALAAGFAGPGSGGADLSANGTGPGSQRGTSGPVGFIGSAPRLVEGLAAGAAGAILAIANVAPELCVELDAACRSREAARAAALQARLTALVHGLRPWGLAGLKAAIAVRGLEAGSVRSPLVMPGPADRARIESLVHEALAPAAR